MEENQNIEWKETWKDDYIKWICGFANADGGNIYIGKNDKGNVVGLTNARKLLEDIPNKTRNLLGIIVDVNLHSIDSKEFIEIKIEKQPFPVNYKGQYHYRSGSTKQELKGFALDKFLLQKQGKRWDSVPIPNISIENLDFDTIDFFKNRALKSKRLDENILTESPQILIENLQLMDNQYLKRAAILLFHASPEKFITGAYIKIGFFKTDSDLIYQDEVHGNLFKQVEKTIDLLFTKYIKAFISYEDIQRIETYEYPKDAIREALLNAISHKSYSSGIPIQISVYSDKIIFWNEGELPQNWTTENLTRKHASKPYNPDIANSFFRSGYIESWGRGTLKIIESCLDSGLPVPKFSYNPPDFWVTFKKDIYNEEYLKEQNLNNRQIEALLFWKNKKEISNSKYAEKFNVSERTALRDLKELVEKDLLKKVGERKITKYVYLTKANEQ
jgi:ATP-dependent DNA helicase RecG